MDATADSDQQMQEFWYYKCTENINCVALSSNGLIAVGAGHVVHLFKACELVWKLRTGSNGEVFSLNFSPQGDLLVAGTLTGTVELWNAFEGFLLQHICLDTARNHEQEDRTVRHVLFSSSGEHFATFIGSDIFIIELNGVIASHVLLETKGCFPTWLPQNVLACAEDSIVRVWTMDNTSKCREGPSLLEEKNALQDKDGNAVTALAGSDQCILAVGYRDGTVKIYWKFSDINDMHFAVLSEASDKIEELWWDQSGTYLAGVCGKRLNLWHVEGIDNIIHMEAVSCDEIEHVAFHHNLPIMVSTNQDMQLALYNIQEKGICPIFGPQKLRPKSKDELPSPEITHLEWHASGMILVTNNHGYISLIKVPEGTTSKMLCQNLGPPIAARMLNTNGFPNEEKQETSCGGNGKLDLQVSAYSYPSNAPQTPSVSPDRQNQTISTESENTPTGQSFIHEVSEHESNEPEACDSTKLQIHNSREELDLSGQPYSVPGCSESSRETTQSPAQSGTGPCTNYGGSYNPPPWQWTGQHQISASQPRSASGVPGVAPVHIPGLMVPSWHSQPNYMAPSPHFGGVVPPVVPNRSMNMVAPGSTGFLAQVIPGGGMVGMVPPGMTPWQLYQQQFAAQQWHLQQHAAYMQYYGSGSTTGGNSLFPSSQMAPPALVPAQHGMSTPGVPGIPGLEGHDGHTEGYASSHGGMDVMNQHSERLLHNVMTLYVGNLATRVDEQALMATFCVFGPITNIQVIRDKTTGLSRGFAFITFEHPSYAADAMYRMNGMVMSGIYESRTLRVAPSNRAQRAQQWPWNPGF
uniref:Cold-inducible RNA-binding protein n=2 Tax=Tetraselmis sp. GSL018 TaxID=582737 RepID=A0A061RGB1_9CHLO|mmetsp:Transcript_30737/g.73175  ORF Transcript_30737/g.73175 Transcript_30737/m.73175 type:complete len:806 (-) Transcript_30737:126-2543(-)|eukprot:CAMPEP_0177587164 /NCGR_PEP_ID=MMETSP0419_2-20121207/5482_1 /TAXON_ID=582737 /ORGANISM="Tetraselmis sp., Strain GSL018" /LENGTH=805 /DNA_ID=CAMNT_0019077149 /DNA_START=777 /DNA_END=3194 /DNA_ORIENTATION=+